MERKGKNKVIKKNNLNKHAQVLIASVITSIILLLSVTFAWFYYQVELPFTSISTGTIGFVAKTYADNPNTEKEEIELISTIHDSSNKNEKDNPSATQSLPLFTIENWQAGNATSVYISLESTGTLDMDYALSFATGLTYLDKDEQSLQNLGAYWYKVSVVEGLEYKYALKVNGEALDANYEPIDADYSKVIDNYATQDKNKIVLCEEACVKDSNGIISNHICTEYDSESTNMISINRSAKYGTLNKNNKRVILRVDLGVCEKATPIQYTQNKFTIAAKIYATQVGAIVNPNGIGKTYYATDEDSFKEAVNNSLPGDNILLSNDVVYYGDLIINKAVNLYTNGKDLTIYGNLVYDYVSYHNLAIDLSAGGNIYVLEDSETKAGGNVNINTPNSQVLFASVNFNSNIYVDNQITLNPTNAKDTYGVKFHGTNLLDPNPEMENIYKTIYVDSDSILNIEKGVVFNNVRSKNLATNIQIINRGTINNIELNTVQFIDDDVNSEFIYTSAPQIVIDNYNIISGGVYLPSTSIPFVQTLDEEGNVVEYYGNTMIIREWGASLIELRNNPEYYGTNDIIDYNLEDIFVREINNDKSKIQVYFKNNKDGTSSTLQQIIEKYYSEHYQLSGDLIPATIKYMEIFTLEDRVLSDNDLFYLNRSLTNLEYLDLRHADVNGNSFDQAVNINSKGCFYANTSIKKLILPESLETIDQYGVGKTSIRELVITSPVTIYNYGLKDIRYVYCESPTPIKFQTIDLCKENLFFVPEAHLDVYRKTFPAKRVYVDSIITDDGQSTVRKISDGYELVFSMNSSEEITAGKNIILNGKPIKITKIGKYAFVHNTQEFDLIIEENVREIDDYAFNATNVKTVELNNVERIGHYAFNECKTLSNVEFENVSFVGDYAFNKCNIAKFNSFKGIEYIGNRAFYECLGISILDADEAVSIGEYAFAYNTNLVSVSIINCESIGDYGFYNCYNVIEYSFGKLKNTKTYSLLSNSNKSSLRQVFFYHESFVEYKHPQISKLSTTRFFVREELIDDFKTKSGESNMVIPLGEKAGVLEIESANSKVNIGEYIVGGTTDNAVISVCNISSIDEDYNVPSSLTVTDRNGNVFDKTITRVYNYAYYYVLMGEIELSFGNTIKDIYSSAFTSVGQWPDEGAKTKNVTKLTLNNVENIGSSAFKNYKNIKEIISNNLKYVGYYSFRYCTSLVYLSIPKVVEIGDGAFGDNKNLTYVKIGDVKKYGTKPFSEVTTIKKVVIDSDNIDSLKIDSQLYANENVVFYVKKSLIPQLRKILSNKYDYTIAPLGYEIGTHEITVNDYTINLGEYVVYALDDGSDNYGISRNNVDIDKNYEIASSVYVEQLGKYVTITEVADYAYYKTTFGSVKLTLPDTMEKIGLHAFASTNASHLKAKPKEITDIDFGGTKEILDGAFRGAAYQIKKIESDYIESIGYEAFRGVSNLVVLDIPEVKTISANAFYECPNITSITFKNINSIGQFAFDSAKNIREIFFLNETFDTYTNYAFPFNDSMYIYVRHNLVDTFKNKFSKVFIRCFPLGEKVGTYEVTVNDYTINLGEYVVFDSGDEFEISCYVKPTIDNDYVIGGSGTVTSVDINGVSHEREINGVNDYAFARTQIGNVNLTFADTITHIDQYAFSNGKSTADISELSKPKMINYINFANIKTIEKYAFENCQYLIGFNKDNNIEYIAEFAFTNAKSLLEVYLPNIVSFGYGASNGVWGYYTFTNAYSVVSVVIGEKFTGYNKTFYPYIISNPKNLRQIIIKVKDVSNFNTASNYAYNGYGFGTLDSHMYLDPQVATFILTSMGTGRQYLEPYVLDYGEFIGEHYVTVETEFAGTNDVNIGKYCVTYGNLEVKDENNIPVKGYTLNDIRYDESDTKLIPDTIEGFSIDTNEYFVEDYVVKLGYKLFNGKSFNLFDSINEHKENVELPDSIVEIGSYAFANTQARLSDLNNVKYIREYAFYNCDNIYLLEGKNLIEAEQYAFSGMDNLLKFESRSIQTIGVNLLTDCHKLLSIIVSATNVPKSVWWSTTSLREFAYAIDPYPDVPTSTTYVRNHNVVLMTASYNYFSSSSYVFECVDYNSIYKVGNNVVKSYDEYGDEIYSFDLGAYYVRDLGDSLEIVSCLYNNLTSDIVVPSSFEHKAFGVKPVTTIGRLSFAGINFNGYKASFSSTIKTIKNYAFYQSSIAGAIDLNEVNNLGDAALRECSQLVSVTAPKVEILTHTTFYKCTSLQDLYLPSLTSFEGSDLFTNCSSLKVIKLSKLVKITNNIKIPHAITIIIEDKLTGTVDSTAVSTWSNNTYVGLDAKKLTFVVPYVDLEAYKATTLNNATIKHYGEAYNYVDANGNKALYLLDLIDGNYTVIDIIAPGVTSLIMPETYSDGTPIVSIRKDAFTYCNYLENFTLSANYKYYVDGVFDSAKAIRNVYVGNNSTYFASDNGVLYSKDYSELIYYPSNHTGESFTTRSETKVIGNGAFNGNTTLNSVIITYNVNLIGTDAFCNSKIYSITFKANEEGQTNIPYMISSNIFDMNNPNLVVYINADYVELLKANNALLGINVQALS